MKRTSSLLAIGATVGVLALPLAALAQTGTSSAPAANPAATTTTAKTNMAVKTTATKKAHMARIDLNTASKEELMRLPGVTDEVAEKIIAARPFKNASELESKKILTKQEYGKVRGKIMVKHEKMASTTKKY
jgi:DNA uptake protein ComE-like DNA-binding protein